jgi:hypothetical protein
MGWVLAGAAFSKILLGAIDPAAPTVPASEAVTKVEIPDPGKSR